MRLVSYALATTLLISIAPFDLSYAQSTDCTVTGISSEDAPPPLPDYDQPPIPGPGYIWTPGYWAWNNVDYYWVPGTWVEPPEEDLLWTPPYWGFVNGAYVFHRGYWGPHVGFYGGVDYGYGYGGRGFEGGHWDHGAFYYNRAVTNLEGARITNVYEKTVVINNNTRVSYNGGEGGLTLRPTAAEEATAREPHHPPTHWQTQHVRAASVNSAGFASTNHGHPAIGATARPIGFEGGDATHKPPHEGGAGALEANPVGAGAGHPPLERHEPHAPLAPAEGGKPVHEKPLAHGLETPANGMRGPHKREHVEPGMGTPPHAMRMQAAPHAADTMHREMPPHQAGVPHMEAPMHREAPHREEAIHYGAPGGGGHPPGHEGGKKRPGEP